MNNQIKYFAYCRKSSEDSQRQIASIDDQVQAITKIIASEGLNLVAEPFMEERSSKAPGRLIFNDMLDRIDKGEANAILCWDIDRLYRNPVDEGRLRWMLQRGIVQVIRTPYRQFYPEDAGLLMGVEGGRATDYIIRLSKNVKRGLRSRVSKGWRPSLAPIGYQNIGIKGDKQIIPDDKTFSIVREIWDNVLSGVYSVRESVKIATEKRGLKTTVRRCLGGKPINMAQAYKMLADPFYYGYFLWSNEETGEMELMKGNHVPMVTENEFKRVQVLLGRKGKAQPKTKEFAFTGLIRCGECNGSVTAEEKQQVICTGCKNKFSNAHRTDCPKCKMDILSMDNPKVLKYTYYHCTKKQCKSCSQGSISLNDLEEQFKNELSKITIDNDYLQIALDYLSEKQNDAGKIELDSRVSLQEKYDLCQKRLLNLNKEYTSPQNSDYELFGPEEFKRLKSGLLKEITQIEGELKKIKERFEESLDETRKVFEFCTYAKHHFNTDDLKKKRSIFSTIGSNITIKDKKLSIERLHPYLLIENELKSHKELINSLEHENSQKDHIEKAPLRTSSMNTAMSMSWRRR